MFQSGTGSELDEAGWHVIGWMIIGSKIAPSWCMKRSILPFVSYIFVLAISEVPEGFKEAVFANGCFWGSEKGIWRLPKGIHSTAVGYCAG